MRGPARLNGVPNSHYGQHALLSMQARTSITVWLWALVLLPTVPLLGFFAYSVQQYAAERERAMEARLIDQANDLATGAQARLEQALGALTALSLSNAAIEGNIPRLYSASVRVQQASSILSAISLVDTDERLVFLTLSPLGTALPVAQLDSMRETLLTGKPTLSKPFKSPVANRQVVALNVPVMRDGKVTYCLRGILRVESLSDLLRPQSLGRDWIAGIFDADGVTVARSLSPETYVGKPASARLLETIRSGDRSVKRGNTREGMDTLTVARPIGDWQWTVAVSVPVDTIIAPVRAELARFGVFALIFMIVLGITVVSLNRRITSRLLEVVDAARLALSGRLGATASTGIRELDDLRDSLTRADVYRSAILEQVEQRTAELHRAQDQLTEFAQRLDDGIERERLRLAREVHDQIGAIFTGVSMLVGSIPASAMSAEQRRAINEALDSGLATARRITAELRPPLLDHLGLDAAVEDMGSQVLGTAGVAVKVDIADAQRLSGRQAIACYRIIQEAMTNALRHSNCRRFEVEGSASGETYTLVMQDDGQGLIETTSAAGHFGMVGMRERARLIGGDLQVESEPGHGLRLRISVPLNTQNDE